MAGHEGTPAGRGAEVGMVSSSSVRSRVAAGGSSAWSNIKRMRFTSRRIWVLPPFANQVRLPGAWPAPWGRLRRAERHRSPPRQQGSTLGRPNSAAEKTKPKTMICAPSGTKVPPLRRVLKAQVADGPLAPDSTVAVYGDNGYRKAKLIGPRHHI